MIRFVYVFFTLFLLSFFTVLAEDMDGQESWGSPAQQNSVDTDGDGRVSSWEFKDAYGEKETPNRFITYDTNGNDDIRLQEAETPAE